MPDDPDPVWEFLGGMKRGDRFSQEIVVLADAGGSSSRNRSFQEDIIVETASVKI